MTKVTDTQQQLKQIYNLIAEPFDQSRFKIWPGVEKFLSGFDSYSHILDIGCGNGKNMLGRGDIVFKGIDLSDEMVKICKNKGLDVIESSMTQLPFYECSFDGLISIASYHHLSNDDDRKQALNEMYRVLKPDGLGLIVVWAMEQPIDSKFHFTQKDELVNWTHNKTGQVFSRYYHIYRENDLVEEINRLEPNLNIIDQGWEKGNWYVIFKK